GLALLRRHRFDFRHRLVVAQDEEGFSGLDPTEERLRVALDFLNADGTHTVIVPGESATLRVSLLAPARSSFSPKEASRPRLRHGVYPAAMSSPRTGLSPS